MTDIHTPFLLFYILVIDVSNSWTNSGSQNVTRQMWWLYIILFMVIIGLFLSRHHLKDFLNAAYGLASEYNQQYLYDDDVDCDANKQGKLK